MAPSCKHNRAKSSQIRPSVNLPFKRPLHDGYTSVHVPAHPYPRTARTKPGGLGCNSVARGLGLFTPFPTVLIRRQPALARGDSGVTANSVGWGAGSPSSPSHRASLSPHCPHRTGGTQVSPPTASDEGLEPLRPVPTAHPYPHTASTGPEGSSLTAECTGWGVGSCSQCSHGPSLSPHGPH